MAKTGGQKQRKDRIRLRRVTPSSVSFQSSDISFADLQKLSNSITPASATSGLLSLRQIEVADKVFQWRLTYADQMDSKRHVAEMANALLEQGRPLDPLLVFPTADRSFVVDGHHRLAAYRAAKWKGKIPVEYFSGTLSQAWQEALARNSKTKLPMTADEKSEAAWKLVMLTKNSISEIVRTTHVSRRTVSYMRVAKNDLREYDTTGLSWRDARRFLSKDDSLPYDDWQEKEIQKIVSALLKSGVGQGLMKNPDFTAEALRRINGKLPEALIRQWAPEEQELLEELVRDVPEELKF